MKRIFVFSFTVLAIASSALASSEDTCKDSFRESILRIYKKIPTVENARMSSRVKVRSLAAKDPRYSLYEMDANFYVKYKRNSTDVRELAGGRMVFDSGNVTCRNVGISEFSKYIKN